LISVREGDTQGGTIWMLSTNLPITLGVTDLTFILAGGAQCCCEARAATTEDITLSGLQTIDGVSLAEGEVCLVKNQSTDSENGPYQVVDGGAWVRTCDVRAGMVVSVREGYQNRQTLWMLVTNDPIELDTTGLNFDIVRAPGNSWADLGTTGSNITLSGDAQTIDGVTAAADMRVLVKDQSVASQNGIYIVKSGSWERSEDPIVTGMAVSIKQGNSHEGRVFVLQTDEPIVVDTTSLTWVAAGSQSTASARLATQGNITLSGTQVIDSVLTSVGDWVLVRRQTTASDNGVYVVSAGAWSRAGGVALQAGTLVGITEGSELRRTLWMCIDDTPNYIGMGALII
jgi:hypothetical protein